MKLFLAAILSLASVSGYSGLSEFTELFRGKLDKKEFAVEGDAVINKCVRIGLGSDGNEGCVESTTTKITNVKISLNKAFRVNVQVGRVNVYNYLNTFNLSYELVDDNNKPVSETGTISLSINDSFKGNPGAPVGTHTCIIYRDRDDLNKGGCTLFNDVITDYVSNQVFTDEFLEEAKESIDGLIFDP